MFAFMANAQEINKKLEDKIRHKEILINECSREGLVSFPEFKSSYDLNYEYYKTDSALTPQLEKLLKNKKIKIVLGTWCGDSKLQVPYFLKVLDAAKLNEKQVEFIAVDGKKETENGLTNNLNIQRVPTFIVSDKSGKELGRIVESPKKSIESDLVEILNKN